MLFGDSVVGVVVWCCCSACCSCSCSCCWWWCCFVLLVVISLLVLRYCLFLFGDFCLLVFLFFALGCRFMLLRCVVDCLLFSWCLLLLTVVGYCCLLFIVGWCLLFIVDC